MIEIVQIICYMITALFVGLLILCMWIVWLNKDEEEQGEQDEEIEFKSVPLTPKSFTTEKLIQEVMADDPYRGDPYRSISRYSFDVPFPRIHELGLHLRVCKVFDNASKLAYPNEWRVLCLTTEEAEAFDRIQFNPYKTPAYEWDTPMRKWFEILDEKTICTFYDDPRNPIGAPVLAAMITKYWFVADVLGQTEDWDNTIPVVVEFRHEYLHSDE